MTVKSFWLALLLAPIFLMGGEFPHNKGGDCPFHKSQSDSRMFGVVGPTRLWTYYHYKIFEVCFKSQEKIEIPTRFPILKSYKTNSNLI